MTISILGELSVEEFLAEYWQKKPLVIRNAFPDFEMPFSAEELAGLACDTDAPSRIIIEKGLEPNHSPWHVKSSPFDDDDFTSLPETHCTFLVNDLERYVPELGNLIEPFRFIPDWRIDDLMVSYAEDQGSVGPHTDDYDVFLIQGEGKRRWKIITQDDYPKELIPDLDIALLAHFDADEEWLLNPGDMLYLPPNMPHHGIAEGACFTFSVGFRAPHVNDLTQNWLEKISHKSELTQRFTDPSRQRQKCSGEINQQDLTQLTQLILSNIDDNKQSLDLFLGKYLTERRGDVTLEDRSEDSSTLKAQDNTDYERESWLRFAYIKNKDTLHFFADGHHIEMSLEFLGDIQELCENYSYTYESLENLFQHSAFKQLLTTLVQEGGIYTS